MKSSEKCSIWLGLFLLSSATLVFEINLTRLFSVAQFYHFGFMIVSIALLGFGASGTAIEIFPVLQRGQPAKRLAQFGLATSLTFLIAFLLINWLPFDSFSIAWDGRQVWILALHYLALASPFFFSGMALGFLLNAFPQSVGTTYAVNLLGSSTGCIIALVAPPYLGGEGMVILSVIFTSIASIISAFHAQHVRPIFLAAIALFIFSILDLSMRLASQTTFAFLELRISPYKGLSYILQDPGAVITKRQWNSFSRVDVIHSDSIHSLPGLSYRYLQPLPSLDGLFVDGDDLNPILPPLTNTAFTAYLPDAVAFRLRPQASTLILEPRSGLDIATALTLSSGKITAVEMNPLIVNNAPIYNNPRVQINVESGRSYVRRTRSKYDVIMLSLTASYHPVSSGAYTLTEDYRYTAEAFRDVIGHLNQGGLLVATRWLQDPPSEDLRLFALAVTVLENSNVDPRTQIIAFRGFNTATILVKNGAYSPAELSLVRAFLSERSFDLTYAPGIQADETNQFNILPESKYYQTYTDLLNSKSREIFYDDYRYDVRPPTDDHPFFGHYFKWSQAAQVAAEFGKAWLPFGGAGYFVIIALLVLAVLLASVLILLPVAIRRGASPGTASPFAVQNLLYFGFLGFAFLFVEIPLLQHFILYLGQPAYAFTAVLFSLLFFSGLGSRWSDRVPLQPALAVLIILIFAFPLALPRLFDWTLGLPLTLRLGVTALVISPLGLLMGVPFPAGIRQLISEQTHSSGGDTPRNSIPWIWAVNGGASVVASILAALFALTFGFSWVLRIGAFCYAGAWLTAMLSARSRVVPLRNQ